MRNSNCFEIILTHHSNRIGFYLHLIEAVAFPKSFIIQVYPTYISCPTEPIRRDWNINSEQPAELFGVDKTPNRIKFYLGLLAGLDGGTFHRSTSCSMFNKTKKVLGDKSSFLVVITRSRWEWGRKIEKHSGETTIRYLPDIKVLTFSIYSLLADPAELLPYKLILR